MAFLMQFLYIWERADRQSFMDFLGHLCVGNRSDGFLRRVRTPWLDSLAGNGPPKWGTFSFADDGKDLL